jgi:phosphoglycolate phosphatase
MTKLILFDIDGTLITGGPAKESFEVAMFDTYGRLGDVKNYDFSGKTDPKIARDLLREVGFPDSAIETGFSDLWDRYVEQLLANLATNQNVALGLVTGNIFRGAQIKLRSVDLDGYFSIGGYGSDSEDRNLLPSVALARAYKKWGIHFVKESVVIVGDTPRDIFCGKAEGVQTVGVTTGKFGRKDLEKAGADLVLDDFSQVDEVTSILAR